MIKACVVGLGKRGQSLIKEVLLKNKDVQIVSVCDVYEDRVQIGMNLVKESNVEVKGYCNYKDALFEGVDAVFIFSDWDTHTEIALYAMKKGIAVASEVGSEYTLDVVIFLMLVLPV